VNPQLHLVPAPIPLASQAELRISFERGPMTRQLRNAALAIGGEAMWQELLTRVSPACRARFSEPIGYFEWVASDLALELHAAWIDFHGKDTMEQRGSEAAREILDGPQRWILRMATPGLLLQALPRMYGFYYRGGRLMLDELGEGFAEITLWATGYFPNWFDLALPAWASEALHMTGAQSVEVQVAPMDPALPHRHHYRLAWKV